MAILDYQPDVWRDALHLPRGEEPRALILEGTWWRADATASRLSKLTNVRELEFPDMFLGEWRGCKVAYCCAYGAARAVEPAHIFAQIGTPLLIQIGTCGSLNACATAGMVVLPEISAARDGVSQYYGAAQTVSTSAEWVARAESILQQQDVNTLRTRHLSWPSLFAQSDEMCEHWRDEGLVSVDMESTCVVAVADYFNVDSVSMLTVWDELSNRRTFMDALPEADAARLKRSNGSVFDVALSLATEVRRH